MIYFIYSYIKMSGFFKTNIYIYIYIYICMFCFVSGADAENEKLCIAFGDWQWYYTLNKTFEFGTKFYSLLENNKSLTKVANVVSDKVKVVLYPADISLSGLYSQDSINLKLAIYIFILLWLKLTFILWVRT